VVQQLLPIERYPHIGYIGIFLVAVVIFGRPTYLEGLLLRCCASGTRLERIPVKSASEVGLVIDVARKTDSDISHFAGNQKVKIWP